MSDTATTQGTDAGTAPAEAAQPGQAGTEQQQAAPTPAELAARAAAAQQGQQQEAGQQQEQRQAGEPDMTGWPQEAIDSYRRRDADARRYQREAGDSRIGSKENARKEVLAAIQAALDPEGAQGEPPTVDAVTQQLTQVQEQANANARQAALVQAAWTARVDPGKLDYLAWKLDKGGEFGTLDPKADDFHAKVSAAVAAQLAADPTLGTAGTVQASGAETHGGASTGAALTKEAFDALPLSERTRIFQTDRATYDRLTGNTTT